MMRATPFRPTQRAAQHSRETEHRTFWNRMIFPMLTSQDVNFVCTLVEECGEMWADAAAWQYHLAASLERRIGGFGGSLSLYEGQGSTYELIDGSFGVRIDDFQRAIVARLNADGGAVIPGADEASRGLLAHGEFAIQRSVTTRYMARHAEFAERYILPRGIHHTGSSGSLWPCGYLVLFLNRERSEKAFSDREMSLLRSIAIAIGPRCGSRLTTKRHKGRHHLSNRGNQVLTALLEGDSEKQAAVRLGISITTVHEHVTSLYRYFGAHSRGELLTYFLRKSPSPEISALTNASVPARGRRSAAPRQ